LRRPWKFYRNTMALPAHGSRETPFRSVSGHDATRKGSDPPRTGGLSVGTFVIDFAEKNRPPLDFLKDVSNINANEAKQEHQNPTHDEYDEHQ
jgi:hypothetical protein